VQPSATSALSRRTALCTGVMGFLAPFVLWGGWCALQDMHDDVVQWTADDLAARQDYDWFGRHFGVQDTLVVSWPGCTLDDPRLERFARCLEAHRTGQNDPAGQSGSTTAPLFRRVISGREIFDQLADPQRRLPPDEVYRRMRGTFLGPGEKPTTCALVLLEPEATRRGAEVLQAVTTTARDECGIDPEQLHVAGKIVETTAIDSASLRTLYWLSIPSSLVVVLIAWPCLRNLRLTLVVWAAAVFCQCFSLAAIHYTGGAMNGMLGVMPILILVIFVSGAVHLINYYYDAIPEVGSARAPAWAFAVGWFPCCLAVGTTLIGVASLLLSNIQPVRVFGAYTSLGILVALGVLLAVVPGAMAWSRMRRNGEPQSGDGAQSVDHPESLPAPLDAYFWDRFAAFVLGRRRAVLLLCGIVMVAGLGGVKQIRGSMLLTDFFSPESRVVRDHKWLEENVALLLPAEVVIRVDDRCPLSMHERLELVADVERSLRGAKSPIVTTSAATFAPPLQCSHSLQGAIARFNMNRGLEENREEFLATGYLAEAPGEELWRVGARLETFGGRRYEDLFGEVETAVDRALSAPRWRQVDGISVTYAGMLPLVAESHPELMAGLTRSFVASLLVIALVLVAGLRSWRLGLLSVLPNVFPTLVVFGAMGWMGMTVDVGTLMTASVGLGIAVDDTVHFLTWFVRGMRAGFSHAQAIRLAYQRCAMAMFRTTAICGAGLAVYGLSPFGPAARFGWIVCVLLVAALVGDLLFLPALLGSRLGRMLFPRQDRQETPPAAMMISGGSLSANGNGTPTVEIRPARRHEQVE